MKLDPRLIMDPVPWVSGSGLNAHVYCAYYARRRHIPNEDQGATEKCVMLGIGRNPDFSGSRKSTQVFTAADLRELANYLRDLADGLDEDNGNVPPKVPGTPLRRRVDIS